jgi:subtilisin family serine protease
MPYYVDEAGNRIELDESPNHIGVRFGREDGPSASRAAFRSLVKTGSKAGGRELPARRFGRFMMLHDSGASAAPVATVVGALSRKLVSRVTRTMPVFVERESQLKLVATEQILVMFTQKSSPARRRRLLDQLGLTIVGRSDFDRERHILAPSSVRRASRALDLANQLAAADDVVRFAAPNFLAEVRKHAVNDPLFRRQWHLDNSGAHGATRGADVHAVAAWRRIGGGDRSIVIAIIDDGIDLDHPDLAANIWRNPDARARDRHGRDFIDDADRFNPRPKVFIAPFDDTGNNDIHGTPCAGVAAAVGNNHKGVTGIAWNCRLMAVKILAGPGLAPNDRIADAIRYSSQHADVLSCSWSVARHPDIDSAIEFATRRGRRGRGAIVCAASGNDGHARIDFPSSSRFAVAVGACNDRGVRSSYSNYGNGLAAVAPSDDDRRQGITTTDVTLRGKGYSGGAYCDDFGGTSSATPLAAGVAALVLSANKRLAWDDVRDILTSTADKIDAARGRYKNGYSLKYGFGRVNADAGVAAAQRKKHRRRWPGQ